MQIKKIPNAMIVASIIIIAFLFFAISGFFLAGSLNDAVVLSQEISTSPERLYEYDLLKKEPFKFRILFPSIIKTTYSIFSNQASSANFYLVYIVWSAIFYVSAALSFFFLLKNLKFNLKYAFGGTILFLSSPAVVYAYSLPVHTREDMLAYTILNLSLICIVKDQKWGVLILSILGVLCRETLLLIPVVYFLSSTAKLHFKIILLLVNISLFVSLRVIMGSKGYHMIGLGLNYNLQNFEEALGFGFLVFSFMWPAFLYDIYLQFKNRKINDTKAPTNILKKSSLIVFVLVFLTTFVGGRINEIRLLFIIFPWVIPAFLNYWKTDLYPIYNTFLSPEYKQFVVASGVACLVLFILVYSNIDVFSEDRKYDVPYVQWMVITSVYLFFFFALTPLYFTMIKNKESLFQTK